MISQPASQVRYLVLIIIGVAGISGCASTNVSSTPNTKSPVVAAKKAPTLPVGERAAAIAVAQVGIPYRYGGSTPAGFDCSGLVYYSYSRVGKTVPRTTGQLWKAVTPIEHRDLRAGDILFFSMSGKMSHVGMYLGDRQFVHAPSTGKTVSIQTLQSDYYRNALVGAGRPK
jgi:cell wall-associated NlpC family hydrolase